MSRLALEKAIETAGNQTQLAARLTEVLGRRVPPQTVSRWVRSKKPIRAEWVIPIEQAVNGAVTRHELRSDLYPIDSDIRA